MQQAKIGDSFVAIKKFSPYDRQSFVNELMIMSEKKESNLLLLLGYIDNPLTNQLWLLTEYMPLGGSQVTDHWHDMYFVIIIYSLVDGYIP